VSQNADYEQVVCFASARGYFAAELGDTRIDSLLARRLSEFFRTTQECEKWIKAKRAEQIDGSGVGE
jgi:hypothetical protein